MIAYKDDVDLKCPHCGKPLSSELIGKMEKENQLSFTITPKPGEFISAKTLGGVTENMGKILESVGRQFGIKTQVLVEKISTEENGTFVIDLLIARIVTEATL